MAVMGYHLQEYMAAMGYYVQICISQLPKLTEHRMNSQSVIK
jgi:hypothetical protein